MTAVLKLVRWPHLAVGLVMLIVAGLSIAMTPNKRTAAGSTDFQLEALVPAQFGDWKIDPSVIPVSVSPDVQATLNRIYTQTLAHTYVNSRGERVMLSIAYGGNQTDNMRVHKPEVCYTAQGFQLIQQSVGEMVNRFGSLPVKRLVATHGARVEPITYWIIIGNEVASNAIDWKLKRMRYGLTGEVADGMLVRVSTLGPDSAAAYAIQDEFSNTLLAALDHQGRLRLFGVKEANGAAAEQSSQ